MNTRQEVWHGRSVRYENAQVEQDVDDGLEEWYTERDRWLK